MKTKLDDSSHVWMGTTWDDQQVVITYTSHFLRTVTGVESLRVILQHELCHILTAPSALLTLPVFKSRAAMNCCASYMDLFREYLAHHEFCRRFPGDIESFREWATILFQPGDSILLEPHSVDGFFNLFGGLFTIFYDAIFFHVIKDGYFASWCSAKRLPALYECFVYSMEDIELIDAQSLDYHAKLALMENSWQLFMNINLRHMLDGGVSLVRDIAEYGHLDNRVLSLWKSRGLPSWEDPEGESAR